MALTIHVSLEYDPMHLRGHSYVEPSPSTKCGWIVGTKERANIEYFMFQPFSVTKISIENKI